MPQEPSKTNKKSVKAKLSAPEANAAPWNDNRSDVDSTFKNDWLAESVSDHTSGSDASSDKSADDETAEAGAFVPGDRGVWIRPTGKLVEYAGWETWSRRQWSWEFLRRNEDYRKDCENSAGDEQELAAKYHMRRWKHFAEDYSVGRKAKFKVGIESYPKRKDFQTSFAAGGSVHSILTTTRAAYEVIIRFQVTSDKLPWSSSLRKQMRQAESRLRSFEKLQRPTVSEADTEIFHSPKRKSLLKALRALDAARFNDSLIDLGVAIADGRSAPNKQRSDKTGKVLANARRWRDAGYLALASKPLK